MRLTKAEKQRVNGHVVDTKEGRRHDVCSTDDYLQRHKISYIYKAQHKIPRFSCNSSTCISTNQLTAVRHAWKRDHFSVHVTSFQGSSQRWFFFFCDHNDILKFSGFLEWTPKREFAHPLNFTYPPLALSSATFQSQLKTEIFKLSYPNSTPAPTHARHHHWLKL